MKHGIMKRVVIAEVEQVDTALARVHRESVIAVVYDDALYCLGLAYCDQVPGN